MKNLRFLIDKCKVDILGIDFETPHLASAKHANFLLLCQEMEKLLNWFETMPKEFHE